MAAGKNVTLDEILALAGDIPAEGMLSVLRRAVYKSKRRLMEIDIDFSQKGQEKIASLYTGFQSNEGVEAVFSYLFVSVNSCALAEESYNKLINFLQERMAYGMAGDVAMEAHTFGLGIYRTTDFRSIARSLYEMQIREMDGERSRNGETNENYYTEMLQKAGRMDEFKARTERSLRYWLGRGELGVASKICHELGKTEDAERYRKLDELLKVS